MKYIGNQKIKGDNQFYTTYCSFKIRVNFNQINMRKVYSFSIVLIYIKKVS
jgi:hypothetical protein